MDSKVKTFLKCTPSLIFVKITTISRYRKASRVIIIDNDVYIIGFDMIMLIG
jgi:hypothetical protein